MNSQEQHLREWVAARRRENLWQFCQGVLLAWAVGVALLVGAMWVGR